MNGSDTNQYFGFDILRSGAAGVKLAVFFNNDKKLNNQEFILPVITAI
jgi:hypothetical protein